MALTLAQKRDVLQTNGLDPDKYDLDDNFNPIEKTNLSPPVSLTPLNPSSSGFQQPKPPSNSATSTFLKSFGEAAPSAIGTGLGAAAGVALAPESMGLSLLLPLLLGGGAGYGTRKLQEAIEPQAWQQNVAQAQQEHPIAGMAGGIATMPLAGLNPSLSNLKSAGGGLAKLMTGLSRTPEEASNLLNVGLGAGIGAIQPTVESLAQGQTPDIKDVLINAGLGSLFSKPNAIGRRLGFHTPEIPRVLPDARELGNAGQEVQTMPQANISGLAQPRPVDLFKDLLMNKYSGDIGQQPKGTTGAKREIVNPDIEALQRLEAEGGPPLKEGLDVNRPLPAEKELAAEREAMAEKVANLEKLQLQQQTIIDNLKNTKQPVVEPDKPLPPKGNTLPGETATPVYSETPTVKPTARPATALEKDVQAKLADVDTTHTEGWTKLFQDYGITHRNAEVQPDGSIVNIKTGQPVAGSATFDKALKKWVVKYNPNMAGLDTIPHELAGHVFIDQLRATDPAFVAKFEKLVSEHPEFQDINKYRVENKQEPWTPEEFIATQQGTEFVNRQLNLRGETPFKTYWKDLWSHIKTRVSKGSEEDFRRIMQYRFQNEPYGGRTASLGGVVSEQKTSEEPTIKTKVKPSHPQISQLINHAIDASEIKPIDKPVIADIHNVLKNDVDWKKASHIEDALKSPEFNPDDPKHWRNIYDLYHNAKDFGFLKDKPVKAAPAGKATKLPVATNPNPALPAKEVVEPKVEAPVREELSPERKLDAQYLLGEDPKYYSMETARNRYNDALQLAREAGNTDLGNKIKSRATRILTEIQLRETAGGGEVKTKAIHYSEEPTIKNVEEARNFLREEHDKQLTANELKAESAGLTKADEQNAQSSRAKFNALSDADEPKQNVLNQEEPTIKQRSSFLPVIASRFDKVAAKMPESKTAQEVVPKLHQFAGEADIQSGRIGNKPLNLVKDLSPEEINRIYRYGHANSIGKETPINLTGRETKVYDQIISHMQDVRKQQNEMGLKVKQGESFRAGGFNPEGYIPSEIDPKVVHEWSEHPSSAASKDYDQQFIDHMEGKDVSTEDAKAALKEYKDALGNNNPQGIEFGALRKAAGKGLPWELVDKNFNSAMTRYGKRAGRDIAYFKYIQNDPRMLKALSLKDQYGNRVPDESLPDVDQISTNPYVKQALRSVFGSDQASSNPRLLAASRVVYNHLMGIGTAARNIVQMPAQIATYVQGKQLPLAIKALGHINESKARAFENNAVKASFADFDQAGYYEGNPDPAVKLMNRWSDLARKYQGRNFSDKFEGEYYYSLGELLATDNIARAKDGNKESINFIKRFGDVVDGGADSLLKRNITQDDISRIAKRFVDAARGSYGPEGLPSGAIEGPLAPFTALSRWSIEKANTVWKDVVQPMRQGIYGPFVRYVLGAAGTGYLVEQMNQLLSNKRGPEPTLNEALTSGSEGDLVAKAISTLQLASFAGIIGDGAQLGSSLLRNKSIKYNQPLSFPMYSWMTDTVAGNIGGAVNAIKEGEDPFDVMAHFVTSLASGSVQSMRYLDSNFVHPEDAKRKEKFRDYNIWQELTGRKAPTGDTGSSVATSYVNLGAKKFKQTGDMGEAADQVGSLINKAIEDSQDRKGQIDPERLKKNLASLKGNSFQTVPDYKEDPLAFQEYYDHLVATQGKKKADDRISEFIIQRETNKLKSKMVPAI